MAHGWEEQYAKVGDCQSTGRSIHLCYHTFGSRMPSGTAGKPSKDMSNPCILLVMGLCSPALFWDDKFCTALARAGPYFVIRFDNRDCGLSTHIDAGDVRTDADGGARPRSEEPSSFAEATRSSVPNAQRSGRAEVGLSRLLFAALRPGQRVIPEVYTLDDMARDAWGLLSALQITDAHLVGSSLGGMIVQCMVLQRPQHVRSLAFFGTHTSNPQTIRWPPLKDLLSFVAMVPRSIGARYAPRLASAQTESERERLRRQLREEQIKIYSRSFTSFVERIAGDTKRFPFDRVACEHQMQRVLARSCHLHGYKRQLLAMLNAPSRDDLLRRTITSAPPPPIHPRAPVPAERGQQPTADDKPTGALPRYVPTIVIHGELDNVIPLSNAEHMARAIPGSTLVVVPGMGHALVPALRERYVQLISDNVRRGEDIHLKTAGSIPSHL